MLEGLKERLYKDCYKIKGGFVGAPLMCRVLAENGLEAGIYEFIYMPTEDMRSRYSKKTLFKDMIKDDRAMEVIERVSPLLQYFLGTGNQDFLHESLTTLQNMFYMGFSKEMIDDLTEELMKIYEE